MINVKKNNILEKETYLKYGYDIKELKPSSCKTVLWKCSTCNIILEKDYRSAKKQSLCQSCSNKQNAIVGSQKRSNSLKEWYKHNKHPLTGTKRPLHVIEALLKSHLGIPLSKETKEKISKAISGKNNQFYGKHHTKETLEIISKNSKKNVKRGEKSNFYGKLYHGKGQWYIDKKQNKIWLRSTWEVKYAKYLDLNNISWEFEPRAFELIIDNKKCTYRPDFYLIETNEYIEIKGYWRDDAKLKYDTFKIQYPNIIIKLYMKKELKELKIL